MKVVSLSTILFCFALVTLIPQEIYGNVVILRGENDRFTNILHGNWLGCHDSKAHCFDANCSQCQCTVGQTFVQTRGKYGECISNDMLVYATSYEATFLLQQVGTENCLYQETVQKLLGTLKFVFRSDQVKCDEKYKNLHWIRTNFRQLLHWETLECMTDYYTFPYYYVVLKKCDRNNQKQSWECVGDKKRNIRNTNSFRKLYYGQYYDYVTTSSFWLEKWTRHDTQKDVCSQTVGCEMFADASSLIILDKTKCEENSECLAEKEIDLMKHGCSILPNKTQYLHNDTWKALEMRNGSFETVYIYTLNSYTTFLQWNLSKTPQSWGGLIVKVQFKCYDYDTTSETEHCVVIKYAGIFKGFNEYDDDDDDDGDDNDNNGNDGNGDGNDGNGDGNDGNGDGNDGNGDGNDGNGDGNDGNGDGNDGNGDDGNGDGDDGNGDGNDGNGNDGNGDGNDGNGDGNDGNGDGNDGNGDDGNGNDGNGNGDDGDISNKDNTEADQEGNNSGKNNTIIIVVCVLLVLVIIGVVIFVIYRHRNRLVGSGKRNTETRDMTPKEEVYANTLNPLYPTNNNQSGQTECALYESASENVYQDVDVDHNTGDPLFQDFAYDYAAVDGPMNENDVMRREGTSESDEKHQQDSQEQLGETMDTGDSTKSPENNYVVLEEP